MTFSAHNTSPIQALRSSTFAAAQHSTTTLRAAFAAGAILATALSAATTTSAFADTVTTSKPWQATEHADHPLVGQIVSRAGNKPVSPQTLFDALKDADYILVGETHDNPDHHKFQARVLQALVKQKRRPTTVWEMMRQQDQKTLNTYSGTAADLGAALKWKRKGWPDWSMYQPIAQVALANKLPIRAGDADRATIRKLSKGGFDQYPDDFRKSLALSAALPNDLSAGLSKELKASHCDLLPESAIPMMANVQRLRDAHMARIMVDARSETDQPVVLIAGSGHTRDDRGVPWNIRQMTAGAKIVSIAMVEVRPKAKTVTDLISTSPDGKPTADFVVVTPAAKRTNQCEALRKRFAKPKPKKS